MHPKAPWTDITFAGVYYHEGERLEQLLLLARRWFTHVVVGVQERNDSSDDNTIHIANRLATKIYLDACHGFAEPTFQPVLDMVETPWTFVVSGDEMPDESLLESMQELMDEIHHSTVDGVWIPFRSTIDKIDFSAETDGHVRLFRAKMWPRTMHSGPPCHDIKEWRGHGGITHARSLDEMVRDYLVYLEKGKGNAGWDSHNTMMLKAAVAGVAGYKGWDYVMGFDWWPQVQKVTDLQPPAAIAGSSRRSRSDGSA